MSHWLLTPQERIEKKYTVADAVKLYQAIQADREEFHDLHVDSELSQRNRRDPTEKITVAEINDLMYDARLQAECSGKLYRRY